MPIFMFLFKPHNPATHKARLEARFSSSPWGFTLIELLVVVFIISVASAVAVMSIRRSANQQVLQNAQQLAAFLDSVRATARAEKTALLWICGQDGLTVQSALPTSSKPKHIDWQQGRASCEPAKGVIGPEPITKAQMISVYSENTSDSGTMDVAHSVQIGSDGLGPFKLNEQ